MKSKTILGFIALFTLLLSCNKEVAVTDISLNPSDIVMYVGESKALSISISPSDAADQEIVWSTSNQYVATVDGNTIKALNGGTATLTATVSNGKSARCVVTVMNHVEIIDFGLNMLELGEGEAYELKVTIMPEKHTDKTLTWTSSDEEVAIIDNGSVVAKKKGMTTITASSVDGIKQSVDVFVNPVMNGQYYVDLGLSVKWAVHNIGANNRAEIGGYYLWGEINPKKYTYGKPYQYKFYATPEPYSGYDIIITKYLTHNFHGGSYGPYIDDKSILEPEDDVVSALWGDGWRMPTIDEYKELINNCSFRWGIIGDTEGLFVTSKKVGFEDNYLFLPAGGSMSTGSYDPLSKGTAGCYWSSSLFEEIPDMSYYLDFSSQKIKDSFIFRDYALTIRGVIE